MEAYGFPHEGKFTAKEVRKIAEDFDNGKGFNIYEECGDGVSLCAVKTIDCQAALRQGADAIERLEAVVKECEKQIPECRGEEGKCNPTDGGYCDNCPEEIAVHKAVSAILHAALGEEGLSK